MIQFHHLWHLEIPHEGLLSSTDDNEPLATNLPPSLIGLHITWPSLCITESLQGIVDAPDHFANLRTIHLFPRDKRGDGFEAFNWDTSQVWYDIEELGIDVECTWHPTECREGWRNEEFDPLVYNVVVFLEDLGPDVMMC
jgi:hypothetical protein